MELLGVSADMSWDEIRLAHRRRIRAVHPDVVASRAANQQTAALNVALDVLRDATDRGRRPLPAPPDTAASHRPAEVARRPEVVTLRAGPGDPFVQLLDAAHEIGDVSYVDPEAGLIQVLLESSGPASSQLLIAFDGEADPPTAAFTLDTMDAPHAPAIRDVVDRLAAAMQPC